MSEIKNKVLKTLTEKKMCYIATAGEKYVDNAMVTYYADEFDLYFGSFSDTLKCRNIKVNSHVAICIDNLQIHGRAQLIEHSSYEYFYYMEKYLTKFPHYKFYFELQNNELYRVTPLVIWYYDSSKGIMHRDMIVFDNDYYKKLLPYSNKENICEFWTADEKLLNSITINSQYTRNLKEIKLQTPDTPE